MAQAKARISASSLQGNFGSPC